MSNPVITDLATASPHGGSGEGTTGFSERDFYLAEFRGRTIALALPAAEGDALGEVTRVLAELAANQTRVIVLSNHEQTLAAVTASQLAASVDPAWAGKLWRHLQRESRVGIVVPPAEELASACRRIVLRLRLAKLVWVDALGPLRDAQGERVSWLDAAGVDDLLGKSATGPPEPNPALPADRRLLLEEIGLMVRSGLPAVNLCAYDGVAADLFTFEGSGTFFARERYLDVRRLALDEFDAAHGLVHRGVAEGYLVARDRDQLDRVLSNAFGVFVEGRYLAGLGALLPSEERGAGGLAGEICSLYTLTRFLGEGVGGHLVSFALDYAAESGLDYVFACTTSDRVAAFFARHGFERVAPDRIPQSKWDGYPAARQQRVICVRRDLC
jgi:N-acetylglutamate synthase-like GNAT family acetyltransferase